MVKVIWESSRRSGRSKKGNFKLKNPRDLTDSVNFISNGRRYAYSRKTVSKRHYNGPGHINPVMNFLRKNIGRPWNDVWSEICEALDIRNHPARELRRAINHYYVDDKPGWGFYIDPRTQCLEYTLPDLGNTQARDQKWQEEREERERRRIDVGLAFDYYEPDDIWYIEKIVPYQIVTINPRTGHHIKETRYRHERRQLGKKMLKFKDAWLSRDKGKPRRQKVGAFSLRKPKTLTYH